MQIKLLVDAGEMKPGPALSQKLGPLGINLGKIISDVNKATGEFKGMKVPAIVDINTKTKDINVKVLAPPTSELLKKELGIQKGSPEPLKIKVGNLAFEQVIKIAKIKQNDMLVNGFKEAVKNVIGSCVSLGILIESKEAKEFLQEVQEGKHDSMISEQKDQASPEKLEELGKHFAKVQKAQEAYIKELEAKKEAKAAPGAPGTEAPGEAAPVAAAQAAPAAPAKEAKKK